MDLRGKLAVLADAAKYDASCASSGNSTRSLKLASSSSLISSGACVSASSHSRKVPNPMISATVSIVSLVVEPPVVGGSFSFFP